MCSGYVKHRENELADVSSVSPSSDQKPFNLGRDTSERDKWSLIFYVNMRIFHMKRRLGLPVRLILNTGRMLPVVG